jgi:hypothetical protein
MRSRSLPRAGRVQVRGELSLLELPRFDRLRIQAFAGIERPKLDVTEGGDQLLIWGDDNGNHTRCGVCGSLLYSVVRDGEWVHVALGSLADAPSIRPSEHIFVGSKAPWFEITDDLPQHEEHS